MDPKAALLAAVNYHLSGELLEAAERLAAYQQWRMHRGYEPQIERDDAQTFAAAYGMAVVTADGLARCLSLELHIECEKLNVHVPSMFGPIDLGFDFRSPSLLDHIADCTEAN